MQPTFIRFVSLGKIHPMRQLLFVGLLFMAVNLMAQQPSDVFPANVETQSSYSGYDADSKSLQSVRFTVHALQSDEGGTTPPFEVAVFVAKAGQFHPDSIVVVHTDTVSGIEHGASQLFTPGTISLAEVEGLQSGTSYRVGFWANRDTAFAENKNNNMTLLKESFLFE